MKNDTPPTVHAGERWILTIYGIAAIIYRIFLFFSISLYVMGKMFAIGLLLAIWTASMWFVMPVGKFINFLAAGQSLGENRPRAIFATLAMVIIGFGLGAYHRWAWYGAVVILLPMTIVVSLAALFAAALNPIYLFVVCLWPVFCAYVAWVLMSQGGRQRYFESCAATARAKQNPDSLAGRRFR